ncbi:N-acetylmuramoyl-L-alanine amidase [Nocardioides sp.]|uniref:peptidoglycan recognition protein family protein n=1 Tax=Nocardioides sp. TaxID=35761 RepID=UPI0035694CB4
MSYVYITWLADALRDGGCTVYEASGWKTRGRPASTGDFAPYGVLVHHTATYATNDDPAPSKQLCIDGRTEPPLPGPLCHVLVSRTGKCWVIAAGRANHAGTAKASGPMPAGDGNVMYVGIEIDYDPSDPNNQSIADVQYEAAVKAAAAILYYMSRGKNRARAHKETSVTGKIDPSRFKHSMDEFRNDVGIAIQSRSDPCRVAADDADVAARC